MSHYDEQRNPCHPWRTCKDRTTGVVRDHDGFDVTVERKPPTSQVGGDHYQSSIEPVQYIEANDLGFHEGNAIKYITRWKKKGGVEDLRKAKHYIEMLITKELK